MATNPKSDAASEAAMRAVEEALEFDLNEKAESAPAKADAGDDGVFEELERKLTAAANDLREHEAENPPQRRTRKAVREEAFVARQPEDLAPANDARASTVAELVYGLQQKPSALPLAAAALFSVIWVVLCAYYVSYTDPQALSATSGLQEKLTHPVNILYLAMTVVPIMLFWAFAAMLRRAQEMRLAARTMTEAAIKLMQPENIAVDTISTVGRAIRREVSALGDGVERALARAGVLEGMVQNEVLSLQRSYSDSEIRLRTLLVDLGSERENVVGHAERLRASIAGSHQGLTQELDSASGRIQSVIDDATMRLSDKLSEREQVITARLEQAGENLVSLLSTSGTDLESMIQSSSMNFGDTIVGKTQQMGEQIRAAGTAVASLIETQSAKMQDQSTQLTQQFEDAIGIRVAEFSSRFGEAGNSLQTMLDNRLNSLDNTLSTKGDAFVLALGTRTEALDKVLANRSEAISNTLKERLSLFGQSMTSHLDAVAGELNTRQKSLEEATKLIGSSVLERTGELQSQLQQHYTSITTSIESSLAAISSKAEEVRTGLAGESENIVGGMDAQARKMLAELDQRLGTLTSGVETGLTSLRELMSQKTAILNDTLSSGSETLLGSLDAQTGNLRSDLDSRTMALISGIEEGSKTFASDLEGRVGAVEKSVAEKSAALLSGLEEHRTNLSTALESKAGEIGTIIASGEAVFTAAVESKYGLFSKMLEEKQQAISVHLDQKIEETAGVIDQKSAAIGEVLTKRSELIHASLGEGLTESQRMLEAKTREFNELLASRSKELNMILESQALPLVDMLKSQGDDVAGKLSTVHERVNTDVSSLLTKLAAMSEAMNELIDRAGTDLGAIENTIIQQATDMSKSVEQARQDVEMSSELAQGAHFKMDETAKNLMANIGGIAERFELQGKMLEQATHLIDNAQRNFSATLEDREGSLDALAKGLSSRTIEIEQSMSAFGEMLTRTMDEMSQRSRLVGTTVSTEIGNAIEETTARFSAATEAMRQASIDVQRELEETRSQMRRGVMELPEETRQSADAMRKVVADQISALRDLSEIVTKSGKALDTAGATSEPQRQFATAGINRTLTAPRPQNAPSANFPPRTATPQTGLPNGYPVQPAPAQPSSRLPSAQTPSFANSSTRPATTGLPPRNTGPAPRRGIGPDVRNEPPRSEFAPAPRTQGSDAPQSRNDGKGWVSDLLQRASVDEAPRPRDPQKELHRIESLNSLSMDIARLIDDEASVDLWERYQRGERNVFTKRLYTLQGQQTFDQIQVKYNRDAEFRQAVDRYIDDFERLLGDVAQNDRDNIMTQTYLTSDTGKVYTMLAHASGRLGS
jgi:hypothetical protein